MTPNTMLRLERILGKQVRAVRPAQGGYTNAQRSIITCDDGSTAFVKMASDELTAGWLRDEKRAYTLLPTAPFVPRLLGFEEHEKEPLLVLEDLSQALWPKQWDEQSIAAVLQTLEALRGYRALPGLPNIDRAPLNSWKLVAAEPQQFLQLGLCSPTWLWRSLPSLLKAESSAVLEGNDLLHHDVRSDNLCFVENGQVKLVDWNWSCLGNGMLDVVAWLPSLRLEGGPLPDHLLSGEAELVACMAGYWAYRAGMPAPSAGSRVRHIQRQLLEIALPWCARSLGLSEPEGILQAA